LCCFNIIIDVYTSTGSFNLTFMILLLKYLAQNYMLYTFVACYIFAYFYYINIIIRHLLCIALTMLFKTQRETHDRKYASCIFFKSFESLFMH